MFNRSRWLNKVPVFALAGVFSGNAFAHATDIAYDGDYDVLFGFSQTYLSPGLVSGGEYVYGYEYFPGFGYVWVPVAVEGATGTGAGVDGYLWKTDAALTYYGSDFSHTGTATVTYYKDDASSGTWRADADHWVSLFSYTCGINWSNWPYPAPDYGNCEVEDVEDPYVEYLTSTWDETVVP